MTTEIREASRAAGRVPLTRQRVLATALRHVDEHGLDSLTMHRLAVELGVGDMSLYNHVRNKDDLLTGIRDMVWAEVAAAMPPAAPDAAWLRALGHAIRNVGHRHPRAMSALAVGVSVFPPAMLEVIATQFDRTAASQPDARLINGIGTVTAFALGWALVTTPGVGPAAGVPSETERQRILRVTRALPPDTPDRLIDAAISVCASDVDALFASGLDAVVSGCGLGDHRARSRTPRPAARGRGEQPRPRAR